MKKQKNITAKLCLLLLFFAALAVIVLPFHALAQELDSDGDGITDVEETLCNPIDNPALGQQCLDATDGITDLYVMFVNEAPGQVPQLPANPFEFITADYGVVPFALHVIPLETYPFSQQIASNQNAVLLNVNPSTADGDLGASQIAYPAYSTGPSGNIFPNRIYADVEQACLLEPNCKVWNPDTDAPLADADGNEISGVDNIYAFFIKNVVAHETFHMVGRVVPPDRKVDYHYPMLGYIMDHHMYYKDSKKNGTVQWYITYKWSQADIARFK